MNGLPYYRAFPRDFIEGTVGMSFDEKGAYRIVLDLIYMHGGRLPDDPSYISGILNVSKRKWSSLRAALVAKGKLSIIGEFLTNYRAENELINLRKLSEKQAENARGARKINGLEKPWQNHTEPEPEPYTDPEISTPPPDLEIRPAREEPNDGGGADVADATERIIEAAGFDLSRDVTGRFMGSGPRDQVRTWLACGLTTSEIEHVVKVVAESYRARGDPPSSLRAFDAQIRRAAARKATPVDTPPPLPAAPPKKSAVERLLERQAHDETRADRQVRGQDHHAAVADAAPSRGR